MAPDSGIGASVLRLEDRRFLTGRGHYVSDRAVPGALHCRFVRSDRAHADLLGIETEAARAVPGVAAVLTGADMAEDGVGSMPCLWKIPTKDGTPMAEPPRWALARGRVRHVGEPVAAVLAESQSAAEDAAELVGVRYAPLPAVVGSRAAIGAETVLHDEAPGNVCYVWGRGDEAAVARAMEAAACTVEIDIYNNRIAGAALEPRAAIASYDSIAGTVTLYDTTQAVHLVRRSVAAQLGMADREIRVISPDVGGGFGYKGKHYPEEIVVCWAARRLGRPVRWVGSRGEAFVTDTQARDHRTRAKLALDADGRFLGLRVETVADLGAYLSTFGAAIPSAIYSALLAGVYGTPAVCVEVTGVFTNTVPTDAYRGAGRPEACYILERLADRAAAAAGIDPVEIRRRNLVPADAMPYTTPIGPTYDCGDFPAILERALASAGYDGFAGRRAASEAAGRLRGIGIASFVESSGVAPSRLAGAMGARVGFFESAEIRVDREGCVQALLGTHNHGQGHATTFAQILSARFGVPLDRVDIVEGDTGAVPFGTGTFGSRSIAVGGSALHRAADRVLEKASAIAAHMLEAAQDDIAFEDGAFSVAGTDRRVSFEAVAERAYVPHDFPHETQEPGLVASAFYDPPNFAFSNGAHVVEVEIDPETGTVTVADYRVVDDVGTVINPMIVEGQVHGGLAQGIGQALMEDVVYDRESGQPLAGSFMDYAMPRADDLPSFVSELDESQPCTHNPLGAKGCGESGSIGAPAALVAAVLDALAPFGVEDIGMPLTAERVWRAMEGARGGSG
ncbi:MAG: xanthine dehydrogenase family protein molybdopterin-binding subunit [Defluviicoccus sp.]|nr:xanthine dehydrogenase family protein molybdopterin-binding subunit [Defluviicoccus sp.]MDE0276240.1 xanthine dehydrogenase family protein molybdopterin-binding subunit [Defluviicoccus sp.]